MLSCCKLLRHSDERERELQSYVRITTKTVEAFTRGKIVLNTRRMLDKVRSTVLEGWKITLQLEISPCCATVTVQF